MDQKEREFSALKLSLEFGYAIVIPLVLFAVVGRLLDRHFNTSPWLLITGIIISMAVSSVALVFKFKKIVSQIEGTQKDTQKNKQDTKN